MELLRHDARTPACTSLAARLDSIAAKIGRRAVFARIPPQRR
jgi:hypothetical protein